MIAPNIHALALAILAALEQPLACGQVTLNFNNGDLQSVETKTYQRVERRKAVDRRQEIGQA